MSLAVGCRGRGRRRVRRAKADPAFVAELEELLVHYAGRPSALTEVPRFAGHAGGARVFLKREDLNRTGSHKVNNALGRALLTKRMGKPRVIAETGAGSHGVATATACALFGNIQLLVGSLAQAKQENRAALIAGLPTGFPTVDGGMALSRDTRTLKATALTAEIGFPAARVLRLTRTRTNRKTGKRTRGTVYAITSLTAADATPGRSPVRHLRRRRHRPGDAKPEIN